MSLALHIFLFVSNLSLYLFLFIGDVQITSACFPVDYLSNISSSFSHTRHLISRFVNVRKTFQQCPVRLPVADPACPRPTCLV